MWLCNGIPTRPGGGPGPCLGLQVELLSESHTGSAGSEHHTHSGDGVSGRSGGGVKPCYAMGSEQSTLPSNSPLCAPSFTSHIRHKGESPFLVHQSFRKCQRYSAILLQTSSTSHSTTFYSKMISARGLGLRWYTYPPV